MLVRGSTVFTVSPVTGPSLQKIVPQCQVLVLVSKTKVQMKCCLVWRVSSARAAPASSSSVHHSAGIGAMHRHCSEAGEIAGNANSKDKCCQNIPSVATGRLKGLFRRWPREILKSILRIIERFLK